MTEKECESPTPSAYPLLQHVDLILTLGKNCSDFLGPKVLSPEILAVIECDRQSLAIAICDFSRENKKKRPHCP